MTITLCAAATLALGAARAGEGEPRGFKVERGDGFIEIPSDSGEMPVGTPVTVTLFQSE